MSSKHISEFHKGNDSRPTKRRRVEMPAPDGFIPSTSTKPVQKPSVPRFHSAFEVDTVKNVEKVNLVTRTPFVDQISVPSKPPFAARSRQPNDGSTNQRAEKPKETKRLSSMMDISMKVSLNSTTAKPRSTSSLRPAPPPAVTPSVLQPTLKQIVPPAFPVINPPSKPLQALHHPAIPVPLPTVSVKKDLRALSTTGLGILSDLSSENAEGLASILLHDQHPELSINRSEGDNHANRGLEMSPEKKGKGKNTRFVRGGLAAYASLRFDSMSTAHILWRKGLEHMPNTLPSPEFCASVIKVLHTPTYTSRPTSYYPGIALCQIRQPNGMQHASYKPDSLYRVVLAMLNGSTNHFPTQFAEGQTIFVFKWQELSTRLDIQGSETPRQPSRLPLPVLTPDSTPNPLDAPINDIALVCTRFHIQQ